MKYSYVLLAYNQQDYIAEAVSAALAQEGPPLEIILSDDCSTDRTFEIMQETASDYRGPHQVVLNRNSKNIGVVAHIRKANTMCSGEILIAASGDDISLPDRSRRIIQVFEETDAWLVHSHADCIDRAGKDVPATYLSADLVRGADLKTIATSHGLYLGATAAIHRKMFTKYGYVNNPRAYEDLVYGFRAALEGGVQFIDRPLVRYRVGSGISTSLLHADADGMRKAEIRRLRSLLAVLAQRRRDAIRFGLDPTDHVMRAIQKRRLSTIFQLQFWGAISGAKYARLARWHPLTALLARRTMRKVARRFARATQPEPGQAKSVRPKG